MKDFQPLERELRQMEEPLAVAEGKTFCGPTQISNEDRMVIELAKAKIQLAETNYKYFVLQIFNKYGLTSEDAISDAGLIIRNPLE